MELGASRKDIIKRLEGRIHLLDQKDSLVLLDKKGPKEKVVGVLYFEEDKLIYGSKDWGEYEGFQMKKLARTLYSLFKNLEEEGQSSAEIIVKSNREPEHDVHSIQIVFGEKQIKIKMFEGKMSPPNLSIYEELGKIKAPHDLIALPSDSSQMIPSQKSNIISPSTTTTTTLGTTTTTMTSMKLPKTDPIWVKEKFF